MWHGRGAELLGLAGPIDPEAFVAVMAGSGPVDREPVGSRLRGAGGARFDVTCSAPKSVSVLWAVGDGAVRQEVLAAHDAAVAAMVGWIEAHAHTRYRIDGQIAIVDAEGIVAAGFRQHTSRASRPAAAHPCGDRQPSPVR